MDNRVLPAPPGPSRVKRQQVGSASNLVVHLLEQADPTQEELDEIRDAIETFQQRQEGD